MQPVPCLLHRHANVPPLGLLQPSQAWAESGWNDLHVGAHVSKQCTAGAAAYVLQGNEDLEVHFPWEVLEQLPHRKGW